MGVIDGFRTWWGKSGWGGSSSLLREIRIRAEIERARTELRLGNLGRCEELLAAADRRIERLGDRPEAPAAGSAPDSQADRPAAAVRGPGEEPPVDSLSPLLRAVLRSLRGQAARARHRPDEAVEEFRRSIDLFRTVPAAVLSPRDQGDFGIALAVCGDYRTARPLLEAAVAVDAPPEHARELARVYLEVRRPGRAETLIKETLLALPADPELHLLQAEVLKARGRPEAVGSFLKAGGLLQDASMYQEALHAFEQAEALQDGVQPGSRAEVLRLLGRFPEALTAFDAAIGAARDDNAWLLVRRAAVRTALDDRKGASEDLDNALRLAAEDAEVLVLAGEVECSRRDPEAALALGDRALAIDPGNADAVLLAARARRDTGDVAGALHVLRTAPPDVRARPALLRMHAEVAMAGGRTQEAIDQLERLQSTPRADAEDAHSYAQALLAAGHVQQAWSVVTRARGIWPQDPGLRTIEVRVALARSDHDAVTKAAQLVQEAPDRADSHLLKALTLLSSAGRDLQARTEALAATERSAALEPDWVEPWWIRAQLLRAAGDGDGARAALAEVLRRDAGHREARRMVVDLELERQGGDWQRATELARQLWAETPDDVEDVVRLARVLHRRGDKQEARSLLRSAELETGSAEERGDRLLLRARIESETWQPAEAAEDLEAAAALVPGRADLWLLRARVARELRNAGMARRYAARAMELQPGSREARTEMAAVHLLRGEADQASSLLEQSLAEHPGDLRTELLYVQALSRRRPAEAEQRLAQIAAEHPGDVGVLTAQVRLLLDSGAHDGALTLLESAPAARLEPDLLALRAETLRLTGRHDEALATAGECLARVPQHHQALATRGLALLAKADPGEAVNVLERAYAAYPHDPLTKARLGMAYLATERFTDALRFLDRAATGAPRPPWVIATLADAVAAVGLFRDAAALYRQACSESPDDASAWNGLGWCLEHFDPPGLVEAEEALRTAVDLDANLWSRKNLANVLYLQGSRTTAAELYAEVLGEALAQRNRHVEFLSLAGWCSYRLGELEAAARYFYEASTARRRESSDDFDLALVHACDGRIDRAAAMYRDVIPLPDTDPQRRRGLLVVARTDLLRARSVYPALLVSAEVDGVLASMTETIDRLPPPPGIRALRQVGEVRPAPAAPGLEQSVGSERPVMPA